MAIPGTDMAIEGIASVVDMAEKGAFKRSGKYDRVDGSLKGSSETVLRFPMDIESASDSGLLVDFQIFLKESSHVASHLRKLKTAGTEAHTKDQTKRIESLKKTIESRSEEFWSPSSEEEKENGIRNMQEFFHAMENDPEATTADGTKFKVAYQRILDLDDYAMADFFENDMESGQFTSIMKNGQKSAASSKQHIKPEPSMSEQTSRLAATELLPTGESIRMYLPGGINFSDNVNYKGVNFGLVKGILEANPGIILPKALGAAASFVDKAGALLGGELNTAEAIEALSGAVSNNRTEQLFEGQEIRTFTFQFAFRPRNADEAREMKKIIKMFRFHMRPELGPSSAYYLTPSEFKIRFYTISKGYAGQASSDVVQNDRGSTTKRKVVATGIQNPDGSQVMLQENDFLPHIKQCALTSFSMNPAPDEVMETFNDPSHTGTPVSVTIDLTFSEKEEISRQDITRGY